MPLQRLGEHPLAKGERLGFSHGSEARPPPGRGVAFEHERAHPGRMAVVVGVERAVIVLHEGLGERAKRLGGTVPGELVGQRRHRGAEIRRRAHRGVGAVRSHDEVIAFQCLF